MLKPGETTLNTAIKIRQLILFIVLPFFISIPSVKAAVTINEVYPAPSSGGEEWVELYNSEGTPIDLTGYSLNDEANHSLSLQGTTIPANGFLLATSINTLNNSGDKIYLKKDGTEIEVAEYTGSYSSNDAYARCPDGAGSFSKIAPPTKLSSNNSGCSSPTQSSESITPFPTPLPTSSFDESSVVISEAMVYPESGELEWVELYNHSNESITLTDWYLDDLSDSGSNVKKFSITIGSKGFAIIELSSSIFNNDGDTVRLLNQNKEERNAFAYSGGERNFSWGRSSLPNGIFCQQEPSRGQTNKPCVIVTSAPTSNKEVEEEREKQTETGVVSSATTKSDSIDDRVVYRDHLASAPKSESIITKDVSLTEVPQTKTANDSLPRGLSSATWTFSSLNLVFLFSKLVRKQVKKNL